MESYRTMRIVPCLLPANPSCSWCWCSSWTPRRSLLQVVVESSLKVKQFLELNKLPPASTNLFPVGAEWFCTWSFFFSSLLQAPPFLCFFSQFLFLLLSLFNFRGFFISVYSTFRFCHSLHFQSLSAKYLENIYLDSCHSKKLSTSAMSVITIKLNNINIQSPTTSIS